MIRCNVCGRILSPEDIDEDSGKVKPGHCSCGGGTWLPLLWFVLGFWGTWLPLLWFVLGFLVVLGLARFL
jgi:hypothetical protein